MSYTRKKMCEIADEYCFKVEEVLGMSGVVCGYKVSKVLRNCNAASEFMLKSR